MIIELLQRVTGEYIIEKRKQSKEGCAQFWFENRTIEIQPIKKEVDTMKIY